MSRTYRKDWHTQEQVNDGKVTRMIVGCGCSYCYRRAGVTKGEAKSIKLKKEERFFDKEIERAKNGDDYYFGSWYEGMQGEEKLRDYWEEQWDLDSNSRELLREAA